MDCANGESSAVEKCVRVPYRAAEREERHQQRGACLDHQLLSEPPDDCLTALGRWLFCVSEMRGYGQ